MSFKEDHPDYKKYSSAHLHYSELPYSFSWSTLESLIDEAGGPDREFLAKIVQKIATKARAGSVSSGAPYQWIEHVVSKIREQVSGGKIYVLMDCLAILCDDGELSTETVNEFLEENHIGYRAYSGGWNHGVIWEKIEEEDDGEDGDEEEDNISPDNAVLLIPDAKIITSKEEMEAAKKEAKMSKNNRTEIFISHRQLDADVADMIKDFLTATGIPNEKIFCSSLPGNDVNERISPEVKEHLNKATINILILSRDYYESAYCLNEAGVAWYLDDALAIPIGLPEISHEKMIGFLNSDYKLRRLDSNDDIAYLLEMAQERISESKNIKPRVIVRESQKLKDKYKKHLISRDGRRDDHEIVHDGDNYDFGDIDDSKSDNPVVQIIIKAGKNVSLREIVEMSGFSESKVKRDLRSALKDGEIQTVGSGRRQLYKIAEADTPTVGQEDVGNIPVEPAFLLVYAFAGDGQIIKVQTLGSPIQVSADRKQFMADSSQRESARWVEALDRLITWGWVKPVGSKGQVYEVTGTGYQKADSLKEGMGINTDNEPLDELKEFGG